MNLYLDRLSEINRSFQKEAGFAARLSESPENWPQEINSDILKQLPFLSDYELQINLDRLDEQRGFAFGYADVHNRTERPEVEHEEAGLPHIRIPVIVSERQIKPFTVFLDGERVLPLTEDRLRESLFNPATFDLSQTAPMDPSLVESLMPPNRSGIGMGGEYKMASAKTPGFLGRVGRKVMKPVEDAGRRGAIEGMKKVAPYAAGGAVALGGTAGYVGGKMSQPKEKAASLLMAIAHTLRETDVSKFILKVASDPTLQAGFKRSGIVPLLIEVFDNTKRASVDDRMDVIAAAIEPTVVTLQKLPGGDFLVKSANVGAFIKTGAKGEVVPAQEAGEAIGQENAQAMQPGQTATAVADPVSPEMQEPSPSKAKPIEEFGEYLVQDSMGNQIMGWVFPTVLAWDGDFSEQPIALFTNGSVYAVQDALVGELVGKGTNLPKADVPRGDGAFYHIDGSDAHVTAPITIGSSMAGPDGSPIMSGTDMFGNQVQVSMLPGLKVPQRITDVEYAIPDTWKWMPLNNQTQLTESVEQQGKVAAVQSSKTEITLFWNGSYNLVGGCGLEKVADDLRHDLDPVTAEFMLGLLGVDGATAKQKVAEARRKGKIKLCNLKTIKLLGERFEESVKTASDLGLKIPDLCRDLTKEAAALEDEGTVDKVLALNFINPENLATFVDYLPELEECSEKLAEMLLMSYLGMKELPEGAIERSIKNIEEVSKGLKAIAHAES